MLNKIIIALLVVGMIIFGIILFKVWELGRMADCYTKPLHELPKYCWEYVNEQ